MAEILEMGSGGGGTGTGIYFVLTYAQAQFLKSTNSLVPGATYRITSIPSQELNCEIVVKAEADNKFSVNGDFYRSNGNIDSIVWHFDSNLITERKDAKNNYWRARVPFTAFLYSIDWDHPNFEGNTIINTGLTFNGDPNAYFKDNYFEDNFGSITFSNLGKNAQVFANKIIGMNGLNMTNSDARFNSNNCFGGNLDIQNSVFLDGDISGCNLFNSSILKGKKCSVANSYFENGSLNINSAEQKLVIIECFFKNNTTSLINIIGIVTSINLIRSDFEGQLNLNFDSNCTIQYCKFNNLSTALSLASRSNYTNYYYQTNDKSNIDSIETTFSSNTLDFNSLENGTKTGIVKLNSWSGVGYPFIDKIINSENIEIEILNNGTFIPYLFIYTIDPSLINSNGYIIGNEKNYRLDTNQFIKLIKCTVTNSFGTYQAWNISQDSSTNIFKNKQKLILSGGFGLSGAAPNPDVNISSGMVRNNSNTFVLSPQLAGNDIILQQINTIGGRSNLQIPNIGGFRISNNNSKYYVSCEIRIAQTSVFGSCYFGIFETNTTPNGGFRFVIQAGGMIPVIQNGTSPILGTNIPYSINTWYHVELEYKFENGNQILDIYIDGKFNQRLIYTPIGIFDYQNQKLAMTNAGSANTWAIQFKEISYEIL